METWLPIWEAEGQEAEEGRGENQPPSMATGPLLYASFLNPRYSTESEICPLNRWAN